MTAAAMAVEEIWKAITAGTWSLAVAEAMTTLLMGVRDGDLRWYEGLVDARRRANFQWAAKGVVEGGSPETKVALALMFERGKLDEAVGRLEELVRTAGGEVGRYLAVKGALLAYLRPRDAMNAFARWSGLEKESMPAHHQVAQIAFTLGDMNTAERWFRKTLGLPNLEPEERGRILYGLGRCVAAREPLEGAHLQYQALKAIGDIAGDLDPALGFQELLEDVKALGDDALQELCLTWLKEDAIDLDVLEAAAAFAVRIGDIHGRADRHDVAQRHYDEALQLAERSGDDKATLRALVSLALLGNLRGDGRAEASARRAVALARTLGDPGPLAYCLELLGDALHAAGKSVDSEKAREEARRLHGDAGNEEGMARMLLDMARANYGNREYDRAEPRLTVALHHHTKLGHHRTAAVDCAMLGMIAQHGGDRAESKRYFALALEHFAKAGVSQDGAAGALREVLARLI